MSGRWSCAPRWTVCSHVKPLTPQPPKCCLCLQANAAPPTPSCCPFSLMCSLSALLSGQEIASSSIFLHTVVQKEREPPIKSITKIRFVSSGACERPECLSFEDLSV